MQITNIISTATVNIPLDLAQIARDNTNIVYTTRPFSTIVWRHRKINGTLQIFSNGKLTHLGKPDGVSPHIHIRRFVRILQKQGHPVRLSPIKRVCMSAVHQLSGHIDLSTIGSYDPEQINATFLRRGPTTFSIFHTGKVVITGIQNIDAVYPVLLELELYTS